MGISRIQGLDASVIKSVDEVEVNASWTQRYAIDWRAQDAYDFKTSGTSTIKGVSWSVGDMAKASKVEVVNGSGLLFESDGGTATQWYEAAPITAPRISASVQAGSDPVYGSATYTQALCLQAIINPLTDLGADTDEYGLVLMNAATAYYAVTARQYNAATFSGKGSKLLRAVNTTTADVPGAAEAAPHKFFEIVFFPGGTVYVSSSPDTDFVQPMSTTTFQKFITTNSVITSTGGATSWDKDDMYVLFYLANNGANASDFKFAVEKFRMLTLGE